ncbi:Domain of unknown function DUF1906 [Marinomonas mediterranea MMB-1]|uniref:Uncharacterized protein n=2 Tax=Marinomonas mediterranea TaxID=119864 RepID=F2K0H7_MARM1|nr:Domain of unknown function DUF1906 [Marinomonas mediterranea MMB-1]
MDDSGKESCDGEFQMNIIDTPWNTSDKLAKLSSLGITTIIRYYNFSNSRTLPEKRLELAEAQHICANGMKLAVVFQQLQNKVSCFSFQKGVAAGKRAFSYARDDIGQPEGSAIYFAVDFDASHEEIEANIIPYFKGIKEGFDTVSGDEPQYKIGVYGSGLVSNSLTEKGLVEFIWLSMSRGFRGTKQAFAAGVYNLCQQAPAVSQFGLSFDYDVVNPEVSDFGSFTIEDDESQALGAGKNESRYRVIARSGLRLREGPGTGFDIIGGMSRGQIVYVKEIKEGWASIDLEGDGHLDGFASAAFLEQT